MCEPTEKGDSVSDMPVSSSDAKADHQLVDLGYHPDLRREFGFFHAFALSFSDMSIIVAFYGAFGLAFAAAGPTFLWGCLLVAAGAILVSLVLGEVASKWPLEGGIYQWTLEQTGPKSAWWLQAGPTGGRGSRYRPAPTPRPLSSCRAWVSPHRPSWRRSA